MSTPTERYIVWLDEIERERDELRAENERWRAGLRNLRAAMDSDLRMTEKEVKVAIDKLLGNSKPR